MKFQHEISRGAVSLTFSDRPPELVRQILKANGFRWNPARCNWWRTRVAGAADVIGAIDRALNPDRPNGACWKCGAPGRFRHYGAASPVLCDMCAAIGRECLAQGGRA
jgi:hypothetical protein